MIENCGYCGAEIERDDDGLWQDSYENNECPYRAGVDPHLPHYFYN